MLYSIERLTRTINNLEFHREVIESKVHNNCNYLSSYYLHHLLIHTDKTREELYQLIQQAAFDSKGKLTTFISNIEEGAKKEGIAVDQLPKLDPKNLGHIYNKYADTVFNRAQSAK